MPVGGVLAQLGPFQVRISSTNQDRERMMALSTCFLNSSVSSHGISYPLGSCLDPCSLWDPFKITVSFSLN